MEFKYYDIKEINLFLKNNNISIQKKFGQNFLLDIDIIDLIIKKAQIEKDDLVLEIGCGLGGLTNKILEKGCTTIGFELDRAYNKFLKENFKSDKFQLIEGDFLKESQKVFDRVNKDKYRKIIIIGNLPYYITKPIFEKVFTSKLNFDVICFMIQKEVREKIMSREGSKKYSFLSIITQVNKDLEIIIEVPSRSFYPSPDVDSEVIVFTPVKEKIDISDMDLFYNLSRSLFFSRRKKINNNLASSPFLGPEDKELIKKILSYLNISDNLRGENLSISQIIDISNELYKLKKL
jgi:16S rRNA (adenine1518-N6/adenine1519-N6)-dimethyltransferase